MSSKLLALDVDINCVESDCVVDEIHGPIHSRVMPAVQEQSSVGEEATTGGVWHGLPDSATTGPHGDKSSGRGIKRLTRSIHTGQKDP